MTEQIKSYIESNILFSRYRKFIIPLTKILIAGGLIYFIVNSISLNEIVDSLMNANLFLISIVLLLSFINLYIQFFKWKLTTKFILDVDDNGRIIRSLFKGFSAGAFTPARVGEYFGRALEFKDKSFLRVTIATLLDKFFPLLMVGLFGSVASIIFIHFYYNVSVYITISLFIVLSALFYFLFMMIFNSEFWDNILFKKLSESKKFNKYFNKIISLRNLDKFYSVKMLISSFLFYMCYIVQYSLLVVAFSNHYRISEYFWAGNLIMFSKTFFPPISFGELGIREGASIFFIHFFSEDSSVGFNASIVLFIINVLIPSLVGLFLLLRKDND